MEGRRVKKQKTAVKGPANAITTLPVEILLNIFEHLQEDKPTLAQCMQVSPQFNSIVAPILYGSVQVDGISRLCDHIKSAKDVKGRKSQSKSQNLALIQTLDYIHHDRDTCRSSLLLHTVRVPTCRILPHRQQISARCYCIEFIVPRKLIVETGEAYLSLFPALSRPPTRTLVLKSQTGIFNRYDYKGLQGDSLIFVYCAESQNPQRLKVYCKNVSYNLMQVVLELNFPRNIVFVNIAKYMRLDSDPDVIGEVSDCESAARNIETAFDNMLKTKGKLSPNLTEARSTRFEFITMQDYLANYDWEGVLSDEEAKVWMQRKE